MKKKRALRFGAPVFGLVVVFVADGEHPDAVILSIGQDISQSGVEVVRSEDIDASGHLKVVGNPHLIFLGVAVAVIVQRDHEGVCAGQIFFLAGAFVHASTRNGLPVNESVGGWELFHH